MPAGCPLTPGITESRAAGPPGDPRGVRRRGSPKPGRGLSLCAAGTHPQAHPALTRVLQLPVHAGGRVAAVRVLVVAVHDRLRRAAAVCGVGRKSSSWVDAGRLRGPGRGREASGSAPSSGQRVALRVTPWPPLHPVCPASHPHPPVLLSPGGCPAGAWLPCVHATPLPCQHPLENSYASFKARLKALSPGLPGQRAQPFSDPRALVSGPLSRRSFWSPHCLCCVPAGA